MKYDVVIIGAGIMGSATAYYLSKTRKKILLLDQFTIENNMNSSQDYSRTFRYEYGEDEFYTKLAVESLKLWKDVENESGKKLYFQCGVLSIGESDNDYAMKGYKTLKKLGHKVDLLKGHYLKKKFPQFSANFGVLDYHGGILEASTAVKIFIELAIRNKVKVIENSKVNEIQNNAVILESGQRIECEKVVVTCGAWTSKLIKVPLKATRQQLVYFKPKNVEKFKENNFPIFAYLDKGFYGFPIHGIAAVKISNHIPGQLVNPDTVKRTVNEEFIKKCRNFLKEHIPELADAKVIKTKTCLYTMTADEDFIIDKINDNLIIGAGFSGHGFKFAPLIGKVLSDLTLNKKIDYDISRFKIDRF